MENTEHRVTLRLPEILYQEVESFTEESGMSVTEFLRRACREKLDREKGIAPDVQVSRAEFEERVQNLEKEVESLKKFIEAFSIEE